MKAAGDAVPSSFKFTKHRHSSGTAGARLKTHREGVSIFFFFSKKRERARKRQKPDLGVESTWRRRGRFERSDSEARRGRAVYPRALTPTAEYLALTLCKPIGGVAKNTTPTPPPIPSPTPGHPSAPTPPTLVIGHRPSPSAASTAGAATRLAPSHVT